MGRKFAVVAMIAALSWGCADETSAPTAQAGGYPVRLCETMVSHPDAEAVVGEFTDWQPRALERRKLVLEGLAPGDYAYSLIFDGEPEAAPPADVLTKWHEGQEYRALRVGDCQAPTLRLERLEVDDGAIVGELRWVAASSGSPIDPESLGLSLGGQPVEEVAIDAEIGLVSFSHPVGDDHGKYSLRVTASDVDGAPLEEGELWLPFWHEAERFSWQDGVMYLAFTDRFRDADGQRPATPEGVLEVASYMGGDFAGVRQAVEEGYFDALGVNILWLSPVLENPEEGLPGAYDETLFTGFHGYWPIDPFAAETAYGGDDELHALIAAAHDRGIRVLFDVVLNHVHEDHVYCAEDPSWCEQTCVCGEAGCGWEERPLDCQFAPYLPDLSYRKHDLLTRVVDDTLELMRRYDADGLRIDAAKHMDHVIMRTIRHRLEALEARGAAEFYTVGETFTGDRGLIMDYVADHELHGQYDFPLMYAIRGVFAGSGSFRDLEGAARAGEEVYGKHYTSMSPFLGNHDIPRFSTVAAGQPQGPFDFPPDTMADGPVDEVSQWDLINRMSMAYAFLLTQPGIPLLYYGDEVGLAGGGDPDNRRFMPWSLNANQLELLERVQALGQARREIAALRHGVRKELWLGDDAYVYLRDAGDGEAAIVAMNKGGEAWRETVTIPNALGLAGVRFLDHLGAEVGGTVIDGELAIELQPWQYVVLTPERD